MTHFPPLPFHVKTLTNKTVIDLEKESSIYYRSGSQRILYHWIKILLPENQKKTNFSAIRSKIRALLQKVRKLKLNKKWSELSQFESSHFKIPVSRYSKNDEEETAKLKNEINRLTTEFLAQQKKTHILNLQTAALKKTLERKQNSINTWKRKLKAEKDNNRCTGKSKKPHTRSVSCETPKAVFDTKGNQCNIVLQDVKKLQDEISYWQEAYDKLEVSQENDLKETRLKNERGNPYSTEIREAVYDCISKNVPRQNISALIQNIVKIFTGVEIKDMPCNSTIANMAVEAGAIAKIQAKEAIEETENLTLLRDGTTKRGHHFYGAKFNTDKQEYTLGIKEIASSHAEKYVEATVEMIDSIDENIKTPFLSKVTNCMTDRSPTEIKTNKLLKDLKIKAIKDLCITLDENADVELNQFHCSIHPLLQFAEECEKIAKDVEKEKKVNLSTIKTKSESFTHNLIRCVSKLFYDDKSGDPLLCSHFINSKGIKKIPILKFKGNRLTLFFLMLLELSYSET